MARGFVQLWLMQSKSALIPLHHFTLVSRGENKSNMYVNRKSPFECSFFLIYIFVYFFNRNLLSSFFLFLRSTVHNWLLHTQNLWTLTVKRLHTGGYEPGFNLTLGFSVFVFFFSPQTQKGFFISKYNHTGSLACFSLWFIFKGLGLLIFFDDFEVNI